MRKSITTYVDVCGRCESDLDYTAEKFVTLTMPYVFTNGHNGDEELRDYEFEVCVKCVDKAFPGWRKDLVK